MNVGKSYKLAFIAAIFFHISLLTMLIYQPDNSRPVVELTNLNDKLHSDPSVHESKPEIVQAVNVDAQQVEKTINRIKESKRRQQMAETERQNKLEQQAARAKQQRIDEQRKLKELEEQSIARKKRIQEESKSLKLLKEKKDEEIKRLAEVKKRQKEESNKLAALEKKQKEDDARRANEAREKKEREQIKREELAKEKEQAEKKMRIAGEVDKYKALIINAISRRWILPDQVNQDLSSQFKIRLAPDGSVLDAALTRSSGDPVLDRSAMSAIYKASPLPVPSDADVFNLFREISLTVRPENARG